jgi:hypothetical protein
VPAGKRVDDPGRCGPFEKEMLRVGTRLAATRQRTLQCVCNRFRADGDVRHVSIPHSPFLAIAYVDDGYA